MQKVLKRREASSALPGCVRVVNVPKAFQRERIVEQRLIDAIRAKAPKNIGDFFLSLGTDAGDKPVPRV